MDPLTITASIVTLIEAGSQLSRLLRKVIRLKKAPAVLLALNNEISDLQVVIGDINDLLRIADRDDIATPRSLANALEQVKSVLLELERFVAYDLTTVTSDSSEFRIDKSVLLRSEKRLQVSFSLMTVLLMNEFDPEIPVDFQRRYSKCQTRVSAWLKCLHLYSKPTRSYGSKAYLRRDRDTATKATRTIGRAKLFG